MGKTTRRRRARLERMAERAARPAHPDDAGSALLCHLLAPRALDVYRPPADPWPEDTTELVHDVRVASRRLVEALDLAAPLLPDLDRRKARNDAKRLRRDLGARREADVVIADLERALDEAELPRELAEPVIVHIEAEGTRGFEAARERYTEKRLMKAASRVLDLARSPVADLSWREVGAPHLHARATAPADRLEAMRDPTAHASHHALRVDLKRLRYTTEILAPVFPDVIDGKSRLGELKTLQDALGVLQDAADLLRFLDRSEVRSRLEPDAQDRLQALARSQLEARHGAAAETVLGIAPDTLGALRRAAGKIGQI